MKDSIRNKQKQTPILLTVLGSIMLAAGFILIKTAGELKGFTELLPYLLVAFGCGIFGHSIGGIIEHKAINKYPELAKNIEIKQRMNEISALVINQKRKPMK